jgi:hypothetical protein
VSIGTLKINEEKAQAIYFSHRHTPVEALLTMKGRHIPFANHVKYLGVIFDKKVTWKPHTETTATKALGIFLSIYPILKIERLSVGAKLIIYKALIRSMLTYACPAWEFAADSYLLKLQLLQNRALLTTGNLSRHNPICDLHRSFKITYIYDYVTQICRRQVSVIRNYDNSHHLPRRGTS